MRSSYKPRPLLDIAAGIVTGFGVAKFAPDALLFVGVSLFLVSALFLSNYRTNVFYNPPEWTNPYHLAMPGSLVGAYLALII